MSPEIKDLIEAKIREHLIAQGKLVESDVEEAAKEEER